MWRCCSARRWPAWTALAPPLFAVTAALGRRRGASRLMWWPAQWPWLGDKKSNQRKGKKTKKNKLGLIDPQWLLAAAHLCLPASSNSIRMTLKCFPPPTCFCLCSTCPTFFRMTIPNPPSQKCFLSLFCRNCWSFFSFPLCWHGDGTQRWTKTSVLSISRPETLVKMSHQAAGRLFHLSGYILRIQISHKVWSLQLWGENTLFIPPVCILWSQHGSIQIYNPVKPSRPQPPPPHCVVHCAKWVFHKWGPLWLSALFS